MALTNYHPKPAKVKNKPKVPKPQPQRPPIKRQTKTR